MKKSMLIKEIDRELMKERPLFAVGDTLKIELKIAEEEGKERLQAFTGTVVAKKGFGLSETFTLYRNAYGCSMERVFMLHSPKIASITVEKSGKVRKAKLYYLRGRTGKSSRIEERMGIAKDVASDTMQPQA